MYVKTMWGPRNKIGHYRRSFGQCQSWMIPFSTVANVDKAFQFLTIYTPTLRCFNNNFIHLPGYKTSSGVVDNDRHMSPKDYYHRCWHRKLHAL